MDKITETGFKSYRYKNLDTNIETIMTESGIEKIGADRKISFSGNFVLSSLPTSDPVISGALWNDAGTVKVSTG